MEENKERKSQRAKNKISWSVWGRTRKEQMLVKINSGKTLEKNVALFSAVRREDREEEE